MKFHFLENIRENEIHSSLITAIIIIGCVIRIFLLINNNSLYGDEIWLIDNVLNKNYVFLFNGLDYNQVAPPLFLVFSKLLINIFHSSNIYIKDFVPKIIPFICGVSSIFVFYSLIKNFYSKSSVILIAMCLFVLNPLTINYSIIFKQYSCELIFSILLLIVFFNIIQKNIFKWKYLFPILLSPWFSLSSFFIVIPYLCLTFFYNRKNFLNIIIFYSINCTLYYFLYLRNVLHASYSTMNDAWKMFGYFSLVHPTRILIQFGSFIASTKSWSIIVGVILLVIFLKTLFAKSISYKNKALLFLPIIFTMIVSMMHLYPFSGRLILFLLPLTIMIITIANYRTTFLVLILSIIFSFYYIFNPLYEPPIRTATSGRQIKNILENTDLNNIVLLSDDSLTFNYYLPKNINPNSVVYINKPCYKKTDVCKEFMENLNHGKYIFIAMYGCDAKGIFKKIDYETYYKGKSDIIYIEK